MFFFNRSGRRGSSPHKKGKRQKQAAGGREKFREVGLKMAKYAILSDIHANADALAEKIGCRSADFVAAKENIEKFDIVLCASLSREPLLKKADIEAACKKRGGRPVFLIDLAVPRNIEEDCGEIEDAFLYNLSDLSKIANENIAARKAEIEKARQAISTRANALAARLGLP